MKQTIATLLFVSLVTIPAWADDASITTTDTVYGITSGATFTYSSATGQFDVDGEQVENTETSSSSMIINLNAQYDLAAITDGLYLGFDLPIIQNTVAAEGAGADALKAANLDTSWATTGLGDASIYAGYWYGINDTVNVGAQLRFKAATGADEAEVSDAGELTSVPVGSGYHNIQASFRVDAKPIDNFGINAETGYIASLAAEKNSVENNTGDIFYGNAAFGYTIENWITPSVNVHYYNAQAHQVDGAEVADTDSNALGFSFNMNFKINDSWNANAGFGSDQIARGVNLPYGYAVMGKNASTGYGVNMGINGSF